MNGEKYIFIRNQDNFVVLRKGADGMVIVKLNQGKTLDQTQSSKERENSLLCFSAYIISIGINQKPEMLVGATSKIGEYLKNCGY